MKKRKLQLLKSNLRNLAYCVHGSSQRWQRPPPVATHGLRNRPRQCEQRRCNRVASSEQWWWRPQCSFYYSQQLKGKRDSRKTILTIACVVTSQILCLYLAKQFAANYSATIEVIPTSLPSDCQQVLQCFDYKISLAKV